MATSGTRGRHVSLPVNAPEPEHPIDRLLTQLGKGVIVFTILYLGAHLAVAVWNGWLP